MHIRDGEYYICNEALGNIEAILVFRGDALYSHITIKDKCIPVFSFKRNDENYNDAMDYDIAYNIIPMLNKEKVKTIVINMMQKEDQRAIKNNRGFFFASNEEMEKKEFVSLSCYEQWIQEMSTCMAKIWNDQVQAPNYFGEFVNYIDGMRYTINKNCTSNEEVYIYGPCSIFGMLVDDDNTLTSYLQKMDSTRQYYNCARPWEIMNYLIRSRKYKEADIVVLFVYNPAIYVRANIKVYDILYTQEDIINHTWGDLAHINRFLTLKIAKKVLSIISKETQNRLRCTENKAVFGIEQVNKMPQQLEEWLEKSVRYKVYSVGKIGAIVMNCNPFTLGHRYLIECAKEKVDILYIFVVEENKSFFKFHDRIAMVKLGVKDIDNVVVIPSGKYIISSKTLPGYFFKEEYAEGEFDATQDLCFFARDIANKFDIQIRFAGEEPNDAFTRRYNEMMARILPKYGMDFVEIPRKKLGGEVISASRVRKYIKDKSYEKVRELVLPEVYDYLERYYWGE